MAKMFRILGDGTRLKILLHLQGRPTNVSDLCKVLKAPQPTVSHHLGIMRMGELVVPHRKGKEVFYSINDLQKHQYTRAVSALLKGSTAIQMGPLVLALR